MDRRKPRLGGTRDDPAPVAVQECRSEHVQPAGTGSFCRIYCPSEGAFFNRGHSAILAHGEDEDRWNSFKMRPTPHTAR